jgi:hypothetical protein
LSAAGGSLLGVLSFLEVSVTRWTLLVRESIPDMKKDVGKIHKRGFMLPTIPTVEKWKKAKKSVKIASTEAIQRALS